MIRQTFDEEELYSAMSCPDVYSEKIRSMYKAYGFSYPFCRFYIQDSCTVTGVYYGSAVVCGFTDTDDNSAELSEFLLKIGCTDILMPWELSEKLGFDRISEKNRLYKFSDTGYRSVDITKEELTPDVSLSEIYEIISNGFDIEFETWYTDTSHNIRHGISEIFCYRRESAAIKMFSSEKISYLSYVATKESVRGRGFSTKLVRFIGRTEHDKENDTYVICHDELGDFYEKAGFMLVGYSASIMFKEE